MPIHKMNYKPKKTMPKAWYEYQEKRRLGLVPKINRNQAMQERAKIARMAIDLDRDWISDAQAEAIMNCEGYHSPISTIPLLSMKSSPTDRFIDNFNWSDINFRTLDVKKYVEENGEIPMRDLLASRDHNKWGYTIKHPDPRKGFLDLSFRLDHSIHKPWRADHAIISHNLAGLCDIITRSDMYDDDLYLYRILHVRIAETTIKQCTIRKAKTEDVRMRKMRHETFIGFNYLFEIHHKDNPDLKLGKFNNPISKRKQDQRLQLTETKKNSMYFSKEGILREWHEAEAQGLVSRSMRDDFILVRYRLVLDRPIKIESRLNMISNKPQLTKYYNLREITPRHNYKLYDYVKNKAIKLLDEDN